VYKWVLALLIFFLAIFGFYKEKNLLANLDSTNLQEHIGFALRSSISSPYFPQDQFPKVIDFHKIETRIPGFLKSDIPWNFEFSYLSGMVFGLFEGVFYSGKGFYEFGLKLALHPINSFKDVKEAFYVFSKLIRASKWKEIGTILSPEMALLIEKWDEMSPYKRGKTLGHAVGKIGGDIFLPAQGVNLAAKGGKIAERIVDSAEKIHKTLKALPRKKILNPSYQQSSLFCRQRLSNMEEVTSLNSMCNLSYEKLMINNVFCHYVKHAKEFPELKDVCQYVEKARDFYQNVPSGTLKKQRVNGDVILYHPLSNTYGVYAKNGVAKTFFRPDPTSHKMATNLEYFYER